MFGRNVCVIVVFGFLLSGGWVASLLLLMCRLGVSSFLTVDVVFLYVFASACTYVFMCWTGVEMIEFVVVWFSLLLVNSMSLRVSFINFSVLCSFSFLTQASHLWLMVSDVG